MSDMGAALSPRERQAYNLMLLGKSVKEIANEMRVKPPTAETYRRSVYRKFGVCCTEELIIQREQEIKRLRHLDDPEMQQIINQVEDEGEEVQIESSYTS